MGAGAKGKAPERNPTQPALVDTRRQPRVSDVLPDTPDLFAQVDAEQWLAERLKAHGCDIYAGGPYETYADRLGACIVRNGASCVLVGRGPDGRPESYSQAYERLYGRPLPKPVPRSTQTKNVPRDVPHKQLDGGSRETHTQRPPGVPPVDPAPDAATPGRATGAKAGG